MFITAIRTVSHSVAHTIGLKASSTIIAPELRRRTEPYKKRSSLGISVWACYAQYTIGVLRQCNLEYHHVRYYRYQEYITVMYSC